MKTIVIKTQSEIDALPNSFAEYTRIEIRSTERIYVKKAWGNSSVEACENSSVEACENSSVVACENSSVVARGYRDWETNLPHSLFPLIMLTLEQSASTSASL